MSPIVIYRLGSLGDTCVALPCFHKIEKAFPGRERIVLTNIPVSTKAAALEVILGPGKLIDRVIDYPVNLRSVGNLIQLRRQLRATGSRTLIYLSANRGWWRMARDLAFFRFCGFTKIIGAPITLDLLRNRIDPVSELWEPEAERLTRTLAKLGPIDLADSSNWDLRLTENEIKTGTASLARLKGQDFFAINMGGKVAPKDWGEANWQELIAVLAEKLPGMGLVVVGAAEDAERADSLLMKWPNLGLNVCGPLSPRECAAVLKNARLFVGHDSGPLHLAAVTGTPCIGLFGGYNRPRKWHPYGKGHVSIHDMRGVQAITVEQVSKAVSEVISI